jgi:glycine oxidase
LSANGHNSDHAADVLVAGGGLAGLIAAWRATLAGADVTVVDDPARPPAAHVAAGMIAPVGEASYGEENLLRAGIAAAEAWPGFAADLAEGSERDVPYRRCGSLHVALDRDEAAELARRSEFERRLGLESADLLGSECRTIEPALASAVNAGIQVPGEAEIDPRALLTALRAACERGGARFVEGRVERIRPGAVALGGGKRLSGERVVVALGAWAGATPIEGRELPVRPVRGEVVRLRAEPGQMPCERIVAGERFYVVPRAEGEVVVGATVEERGFDTRVTAGGVHELLRESYRAMPELAELELVEVAAGLRPGSPDNAPIIGLAEEGLFVVGGLFRNGILLAPTIAAAVDAELGRGEPPAELAPLGLDRFDRVEAP